MCDHLSENWSLGTLRQNEVITPVESTFIAGHNNTFLFKLVLHAFKIINMQLFFHHTGPFTPTCVSATIYKYAYHNVKLQSGNPKCSLVKHSV